MTRTPPTPPAKPKSLAQQKSDMTSEGSPPPGKPVPKSPFTGPLGHKQPPWGRKR